MEGKRWRALAAALIFAIGMILPAGAEEVGRTYTGDVLLAVNSSLSTSPVEGSFTLAGGETAAALSVQGAQLQDEVCALSGDADTGGTVQVLAPRLEMPEPVSGCREDAAETVRALSACWQEGDTFSLTSLYSPEKESMICLFVGTYCTVWTSAADPQAIRLSAEKAEDIAAYFDGHYPAMTAAFGQFYDADGDGRVAILCYDLKDDFAAGAVPNSYTAGYFYGGDMIDSNGRVNGVNYGAAKHINGLDCIHVDTFPTMGRDLAAPLGNVEGCYSTLFHEFQHMINFSYQVRNGSSGYVTAMETYLNEAFSMAAEHLICGQEETQLRVDFFNSDYYTQKYVTGTGLTSWEGNLSAYSNSYLFGQYIRTRYAQLLADGSDGSGIYKTVLESRTADNEGDTLGIIAGLLNTTGAQLVQDFWSAVYCKAPSGAYGFNGESWADDISPVVESDFSNTGGIGSGGVKYYSPGAEGCTVAAAENLAFSTLSGTGGEQVQVMLHQNREEGTVNLEVWAGEGARTAAVILYSSEGRMLGLEWMDLSSGRATHRVEREGGRLQVLALDGGNLPLCRSLSCGL